MAVVATKTLNNRELGELIGLTHSSVSRIRHGFRRPSSTVMLTIQDKLGWPVDEQIRTKGAKYAKELERRVRTYAASREAVPS